MAVVKKSDDGAMHRAYTYEDETGPWPCICVVKDDAGWREWQCKICTRFEPKRCKADKVYDGFKSHVLHVHDDRPAENDGTMDSSMASYLFPASIILHREKVAARAAEKAAKAAAVAQLPAPPLPQAVAPLTYDGAVDALVAAGFTATGDELATLAADVKKRIGVEPASKKPRSMTKELAALGNVSDAGLPPRGDAAARQHQRRGISR